MTSFVNFNALQVIAALLIFVAGYLALLLLIVICLVIGAFVHEGARLVQAYAVKCNSLDDSLVSETKDNTRGSRALRHTFQSGLSKTLEGQH